MKYLVFLFALLTLPAHAQKAKRFVTYYDSTKTAKREVYTALVAGDTLPQGTYRRYYRSGQLEQQTSFREGKRDSAYVEFHPSGARRLETTYRAGVRQGPFKTYYANGKVAQEGNFDNDEPSGELTYYHPTGEVKLKTMLAKGQPNGTLRQLYADGKPQADLTYKDGQPEGAVKFYYANGQVQSEGTLHRGLLAGPYKTYYPTGQIETEVQADASGRGGYRSYYPSGKLQTEGTYAPAPVVQRAVRNPLGDDLAKRVAPTTSGTANLDGPATSYYENGQVKTKTTYRLGVPTGHAQEFSEAGKLELETDYANAGRDRKVTRYGAAGPLPLAEETYKNNRPAGTWRTFFPGSKQVQSVALYNPAGKLAGEQLTYFADGKVASRLVYENGYATGLGLENYPSGKLKAETTYAHGLKAGPYRQLREDGTLAVRGAFRNGKETGVWTYFGPDGVAVESRKTFQNGLEVPAGTKAPGRPTPRKK
ncbi:toxin-antitoxin system YwqK family antitoxin [Hymenobacter nivis]|uniref:Toxin-antitoxin system YwqK family antitoxin n=1 Tax=Hymenobacter nivis TaxID=1850093 RepID=A0A502GXU9_9BACT|nr:toxin-antitoxin system YwqK family antitoxin [Hymenobacter nivis]TPG65793.1 toxin-antitoxin system YwqK family antitoxin [Hymenobacter nivis]